MSGTLCRDLANMVERPMPGPVSPLVGPSTNVPHLTAEEWHVVGRAFATQLL